MCRFSFGLLLLGVLGPTFWFTGCTVDVDPPANTPRVDVDADAPPRKIDVDVDVDKTP